MGRGCSQEREPHKQRSGRGGSLHQDGTRQCLAGAWGQCGERWTRAGTSREQTCSHPGGCFSAQWLTRWQAKVPGSLCKAHGCFSGTKSKALSSGENQAPR